MAVPESFFPFTTLSSSKSTGHLFCRPNYMGPSHQGMSNLPAWPLFTPRSATIAYSAWLVLNFLHSFNKHWLIVVIDQADPIYWVGLPFPSSGNLPNRGMETASPAAREELAGRFFTTEPPGKPRQIASEGEMNIWSPQSLSLIRGGRQWKCKT